jgi:hypothetical protein
VSEGGELHSMGCHRLVGWLVGWLVSEILGGSGITRKDLR